MAKKRITAVLLLLLGVGLGYLVYSTQAPGSKWNFKLGLDLRGGSQLIYKADVSKIVLGEVNNSLDALRDVIERRVNLFGVTEPNVQTQTANVGVVGTEHRLLVELPGVTDINAAIALIGQTPTLEFKTERDPGERDLILKQIEDIKKKQEEGKDVSAEIANIKDPYYVDTELTGRFLSRSSVEFSQTGQPYVSLQFNDEGAKLFAEITKANIGKTVAIYLDGQPISQPTVQGEITGGQAQITGGFTPLEAKQLAGRLNSGALPIPIELIATNKIGATLGEGAFDKGVKAATIGYAIMAIFLILWYRLPGFVAALALAFYSVIVLVIFKSFGVTLTAAGIAGFILSLGMAVDANVLIFERMKEEKKRGKLPSAALEEGFARAWTSIRDANISSFITAVILFWFGTSLIKGFALVWMIGIGASIISAVFITKRFMRAIYS
ncbi:MAG TPA: protein translocase subunit SecD [Candidatus Paceibacterota bacterium]